MPNPSTPGIRRPTDLASDAMMALMQRLNLPNPPGAPLTRQEAHHRIERFFEAHPDARKAHEAERAARNRARWITARDSYHARAVSRRAERAASPAQIHGLMRRAFGRTRGDRLRAEILAALQNGVSLPHAYILIRKADGTFRG